MASTEIPNATGARRRARHRAGSRDRPVPCCYAFTLIELLVVISILTLLMAILLPVLGRVRDQARAVGCQANLRQWGVLFAVQDVSSPERFIFWRYAELTEEERGRYGVQVRKLLLCPMASRPSTKGVHEDPTTGYCSADGTTFSAWWSTTKTRGAITGSYGANAAMPWVYGPLSGLGAAATNVWWGSPPKQASLVPVLFDCRRALGSVAGMSYGPPPYEEADGDPGWGMFINRHHGGTNYLFLDWSVRKAGIKEPFTLKWDKSYDTANVWTKAGGVTREKWPVWMQKFEDY